MALGAAAAALGVAHLKLDGVTGRSDGIQTEGPLLVRDVGPKEHEDQLLMAVRGEVTISSGCVLVAGHLAIWPGGTSWDADHHEVVLASGRHVKLGQTIIGGGGLIEEPGDRDPTSAAGDLGDLPTSCNGDARGILLFNTPSDIRIVGK